MGLKLKESWTQLVQVKLRLSPLKVFTEVRSRMDSDTDMESCITPAETDMKVISKTIFMMELVSSTGSAEVLQKAIDFKELMNLLNSRILQENLNTESKMETHTRLSQKNSTIRR